MHEDPQIPNYGDPGTWILLEEGMVLAVEPMVTAGRHAVRVGDDHWAIYSQDGSLAAHFEFTIAITAFGSADLDALARSRRSAHSRAAIAVSHRRGEDGPAGGCVRPPPAQARATPETSHGLPSERHFRARAALYSAVVVICNGLQSRAVGTTGNSRRERNEP